MTKTQLSFTVLAFLSCSSAALANGSLWCTLLRTPTELSNRNEMPYSEIQIDLMNSTTLQLDETDHYHDGKKNVRKLELVNSSPEFEIAGVALGTYSNKNESVKLAINENGKITLSNGFFCEIPGDYRSTYRPVRVNN